MTTLEFIKKSESVFGKKFDYSVSNYVNARTKLDIICPIHGKFSTSADNHINKKVGCKKCSSESLSIRFRDTLQSFVKKSELIHGKKYDYSSSVYGKNNSEKILIICKEHGEFFQRPGDHLSGMGCYSCGRERIRISSKMNNEEFILKSKSIHGDRYDYSLTSYLDYNIPVKIICKKHGHFFQVAGYHCEGSGCRKCSNLTSKPEGEFLDYLNIPNSTENRQKYIKPFKVDGFVKNSIYEFLGDFWHGNPKKYSKHEINPISKKTFGRLYEETIEKFKYLSGLKFNIYYIWESDWINWKSNQLSDFPLKEFN